MFGNVVRLYRRNTRRKTYYRSNLCIHREKRHENWMTTTRTTIEWITIPVNEGKKEKYSAPSSYGKSRRTKRRKSVKGGYRERIMLPLASTDVLTGNALNAAFVHNGFVIPILKSREKDSQPLFGIWLSSGIIWICYVWIHCYMFGIAKFCAIATVKNTFPLLYPILIYYRFSFPTNVAAF